MTKNNPNSWMQPLHDTLSLAALSIPGTHDSAALYGGSIAQCQTLTIEEQLQAGVRFFDIRCKLKNGELKLYHGIIDQKGTLDEVIATCFEFLNQNKQETVIMCIKNEDNGVTEEAALAFETAVYARITPQSTNWYLENTIPNLGAVRGKITLFRRFSSVNPQGIAVSEGWSDDATFTIGDHIKIQDQYNTNHDNVALVKWPAAKAILDEAIAGPSTMVYINFLSATGGLFGASPKDVALGSSKIPTGMVIFLESYTASQNNPKRLGWILFDFPTTKALDAVIASNF